MVECWGGDGVRLNLGCGSRPREGFVNVDVRGLGGVDVVWDLDVLPWPFEDGCASLVLAEHVFEHVDDLVAVIGEVHRVLGPGGLLLVRAPHYRHEVAFADPTHRRFFTERSLDYFCVNGAESLERYGGELFERLWVVESGWEFRWPGSWHVWHWLGVRVGAVPVELSFLLRRVEG